ncbi:hypothetical protein JTB14_004550 [Gonioctena quinquepunctata]|nr:hypothetical protein JTB14_004550 [Gonioctena quinquepunctata]
MDQELVKTSLKAANSQEKLNKHTEDCAKMNETAIRMPEEGMNTLKFKNFKNKEKAPFVIYADLESVLKLTDDVKKPQHHIPAAVGYYMKCSYDDTLSLYRSY